METQAMTPMPRYQSHKKVWALKIKSIETLPNGGAIITPEEPGFGPFEVTFDYVAKHGPDAGGYFVQYEDGYKSYSPAEAFESGYTALAAAEAFASGYTALAPVRQHTGKQDDLTLLDHTFSYHRPTEDQLPKYDAIRKTARVFAMVILDNCPPSADRSAAIRKVREAVMTANASIGLGGRSI